MCIMYAPHPRKINMLEHCRFSFSTVKPFEKTNKKKMKDTSNKRSVCAPCVLCVEAISARFTLIVFQHPKRSRCKPLVRCVLLTRSEFSGHEWARDEWTVVSFRNSLEVCSRARGIGKEMLFQRMWLVKHIFIWYILRAESQSFSIQPCRDIFGSALFTIPFAVLCRLWCRSDGWKVAIRYLTCCSN